MRTQKLFQENFPKTYSPRTYLPEADIAKTYSIELCGLPTSVFVRKVYILLVEKNLPFTFESPTIEKTPEFLEMNPSNKPPVLKLGPYTLTNSSAICAYLEGLYPSPALYPQERQAYDQALQFEKYADIQLFSALEPLYFQKVMVPLCHKKLPDEQMIVNCLDQHLPVVCDFLNNHLNEKHFLVNNQFSIADIAVATQFLNMFAAGFYLEPGKWPLLEHYLDGILSRPSFQLCKDDLEIVVNQSKKSIEELQLDEEEMNDENYAYTP